MGRPNSALGMGVGGKDIARGRPPWAADSLEGGDLQLHLIGVLRHRHLRQLDADLVREARLLLHLGGPSDTAREGPQALRLQGNGAAVGLQGFGDALHAVDLGEGCEASRAVTDEAAHGLNGEELHRGVRPVALHHPRASPNATGLY